MSGDLVTSLADFVGILAEAPDPADTSSALVECFADSLGMRSAAVLVARPPLLIVYALHGHSPAEADTFESLPLSGDYPVTRAFHEGEVIVETVDEVARRYEATSRPTSRYQHTRRRIPDGISACAPLISAGQAVGGIATSCDGGRTWGSLEIAAFAAAGHALGMWLTHDDSGLPTPDAPQPPHLTERQLVVMRLAADGHSNAQIAARLGYSESTIKQEMSRIRRLLDADSRFAAMARARELDLISEAAE